MSVSSALRMVNDTPPLWSVTSLLARPPLHGPFGPIGAGQAGLVARVTGVLMRGKWQAT
jgi:hypothetical protein